jgi:hypothetical protein
MERHLCSRCAGRAYRFLKTKGLECKLVSYYLPHSDPRVKEQNSTTHVIVRVTYNKDIYTLDPSTIPLRWFRGLPSVSWHRLPDDCQPIPSDYEKENGGIYG